MTHLCERGDFPQLIEVAASELGIDPAIVEKDYYVTETLRIIAERFGDVVLFKGGTSLSKGWKLIDRFSEDIDLYVQPDRSSGRATDRRLKAIAEAVAGHPWLTRDESRKRVSGGFGRTEYFVYQARAGVAEGIEASVMLEAGIQSGVYPVEERPIQSLIAELLDQRGIASGTTDQAAFRMRLLHFRRTFIEKLYTIHDRVERLVKRDGKPLGSYARHYYDLYRLLQTAEVQNMLPTDEYSDIASDYRRLTTTHYPDQALPPRMALRNSSALFPEAELRGQLQREYEDQCRRLCREYPSFDEVLSALKVIRELLVELPD